MKRPLVHVVGAGAAGLAAAYKLATSGRCDVVVHEARAFPGGRRRSFYDEAFGGDVDTGNFPILAGWRATQALIDAIGARNEWRAEKTPGVDFVDLAKGLRWRLRPNPGRIPWWLLLTARRGPDLTPAHYWQGRRLLSAGPEATVQDCAPRSAEARERLWRPLTRAAFNAQPEAVSARLAGRALREAVLAGGKGLTLMLPQTGIGRALVEPLARAAARSGAALRFERRLVGLVPDGRRLGALDFEHDRVELGQHDGAILALSWDNVAELIPGLAAPSGASMSLTVHFATPAPSDAAIVLGVLNGPFDWLFSYRDRISVTIRDAAARIEAPREAIAAECWAAAAALTGHSDGMPSWRVVPSRRSSFLASPAEILRRPPANTSFANLFLAGGHIAPQTTDSLEGAIQSGQSAAERFLGRQA